MGLDTYQAFVQVVEQGSLSAAARALGVPRPTVSRRLARLEERLGERLVQRGARQAVITRAGQELYQQIRGPLGVLLAAEQAVRDRSEAPRGLLKVAMPPLLAAPLAPALVALQALHPHLAVEVFTETRFVDLAAEGFDVALRAGVLRTPALVQRRLHTMQVGLYAAPRYLEAHGTPRTVGALAQHRLLRGHTATDTPRTHWPLVDGGTVPVDGDFVTNDRELLRAACAAGHGLALLSDIPAVPAPLVPVLPRVGARLGLYVVYPDRPLLPPRTRVFVDAMVRFFAEGFS